MTTQRDLSIIGGAVAPTTVMTGPVLWLVRGAYVILTATALALWVLGVMALLGKPPADCSVAVCDPVSYSAADLALMRELGWPSGLLRFIDQMAALMGAVYFVAAGILASKRSNDWLALVASFALVFLGAVFFTSADDALLSARPGMQPVLNLVQLAGMASFMVLLFTFPNGRMVPAGRVARWAVGLTLGLSILLGLLQIARGGGVGADRVTVFFAPLFVTGLAAQVYRYRRVSTLIERRQTQWILIGLAVTLIVMLLWLAVRALYPPSEPSVQRLIVVTAAGSFIAMMTTLFPLTFVFSILRYRLWDIDVFVRRTAQYTLVTGMLVLVYFGLVVVLQRLFTQLTGQQSTVAVVLSTLAIAALFNPLRRRVQSWIDWRFYRRKYDAEQVLEQFAATVRDETDLDALTAELVQVIQETMQPEFVSVWLAAPEEEW